MRPTTLLQLPTKNANFATPFVSPLSEIQIFDFTQLLLFQLYSSAIGVWYNQDIILNEIASDESHSFWDCLENFNTLAILYWSNFLDSTFTSCWKRLHHGLRMERSNYGSRVLIHCERKAERTTGYELRKCYELRDESWNHETPAQNYW
jgi:hypothetical protein